MNRPLLVLIFFAIVTNSCSTSKKPSENAINNPVHFNEIKEVNYGPSRNENDGSYFLDQTEKYGLSNLYASSLMLVDLNQDGYSDLVILPEHFGQPVFFIFNPKINKFEKVDSLFDEVIQASFILFYDFTGDKIVDALVGFLNRESELTPRPLKLLKGYKSGKTLRFKEVPDAFNIPSLPTTSIGLIDYNLDGYLDLFVGNFFEEKNKNYIPQRDYLLMNKKGRFVDVSNLLDSELKMNSDKTTYLNAMPTFGAQVCDINFDGNPDILTISTNGYPNKLWLSEVDSATGRPVFRDRGTEALYSGDFDGMHSLRGNGKTLSLACADYNNDGIMDIFLGELYHSYDQETVDRSSILTGSRPVASPKFLRTEYTIDQGEVNWTQADRRAIWFDYNNDGLMDLLVDNSGHPPNTRMILFEQQPDHSFENVAQSAGVDIVNPASSVILDINKDGKMDILTAQSDIRDSSIKKRLYLFVSQAKNENRSVRFFLRGENSNHLGLNAVVQLKVEKDGKVETRMQQVSYSYGNLPPQNEEGILFGIEKSEKLISVEVTWPFSKNLNKYGVNRKVFNIKEVQTSGYIEMALCENGSLNINSRKCPAKNK